MKTKSATPLLLSLIAAISLSVNQHSAAQAGPRKETKTEDAAKKTDDASKPTAPAQKPLPADPEERFKVLFTKAYLSGRWAPLKDGALGEERTGDK